MNALNVLNALNELNALNPWPCWLKSATIWLKRFERGPPSWGGHVSALRVQPWFRERCSVSCASRSSNSINNSSVPFCPFGRSRFVFPHNLRWCPNRTCQARKLKSPGYADPAPMTSLQIALEGSHWASLEPNVYATCCAMTQEQRNARKATGKWEMS